METLFDKIIKKEIPAEIIYETDYVLSFMDINPHRKGHVLVIPKTPTKDIFELKEEDAGHLMKAIKKISHAVKNATGAKGIQIIANNGKDSGQIIFHLHFHIIPRYDMKEFPKLPEETYKKNEMREIAKKIKNFI